MGTLDISSKVGPGGQHQAFMSQNNRSDQHLYPNSSEKMRNHLAEDMLNEDFLYLMEAFQSDLNDGSHLTLQYNCSNTLHE